MVCKGDVARGMSGVRCRGRCGRNVGAVPASDGMPASDPLRAHTAIVHEERLTTRVGERTVDWAVLEPGDEIVIGPHRIRFEMTGED